MRISSICRRKKSGMTQMRCGLINKRRQIRTECLDVLLCNVIDQSVSLIKQVLSNAGKIDEGLDVEAFEQASIADPGEFQKLRSLERA
jgi:hypothetical protein